MQASTIALSQTQRKWKARDSGGTRTDGRATPIETILWKYRYLITAATVAFAFFIRLMSTGFVSQDSPYLVFFTAVVISAWIGGLRTGLLATALSTVLSFGGFLQADGTYLLPNFRQFVGLLTFLGEATLVSLLFHSLHRSRARTRTAMREAQEARVAAEEASRAKKDFIVNMSHEIRTPLTTILGFTELIMKPELADSERERYLPKIQSNVKALSLLIDDILEISAIERGGLEVQKQSFGLVSFLSSLEEELRPLAEQKGVGLELSTKGFIPLELETDVKKLHQILVHVVSSAIRFTEGDTVSVVTSMRKLSRVKSPSGQPGASLAFIVKCGTFAPGHNVHLEGEAAETPAQALHSTGDGVELGLPLARRLARVLGGDIKLVRTRRGRGSTFLVTLPISAAPEFESSMQEMVVKSLPEKKASPVESHRLEGLKVLLVEDSPDNRLLVSRFLDMAGAIVETAKNGQEGIEKACQGDFNVVVMDIQMPVLDGNHAAQKLRERNFNKPLIALSAHALHEDQQTALDSGFDDYLIKPVNRTDLIEKVRRHARRSLTPAFT